MNEAINDREAAAREALHKIKGKVHSKHRTDKANKKNPVMVCVQKVNVLDVLEAGQIFILKPHTCSWHTCHPLFLLFG